MRFVDLFAGLGGFHVALRQLGYECVFACEVDETLREVYKQNFGIEPKSDIRKVELRDVPEHDLLCAGFPCQPFSKAGFQDGFDSPDNGDLIDHVLAIVKKRLPALVLLENVPEFVHHDGGRWWRKVEACLDELGYAADHRRLSPHKFGIPQVRDRLFIVAASEGLEGFVWPEPTGEKPSLRRYLDQQPTDAKRIDARVQKCLAVWQDFLDRSPRRVKLPSFPIWTMEFGADYPFEGASPYSLGDERLREYKGAHGRPLGQLPTGRALDGLPSYARAQCAEFPRWKQTFIRQNREFYNQNRTWIDEWLPTLLEADFPASWQKLEWNCKGAKRDLKHLVIQFRASGVRVKRATTSPSLIAMTDTQVPIIPWEDRYITPREAAKLQSLETLTSLPESRGKAFEALGNAVNATMVRLIVQALVQRRWSHAEQGTPPRLRSGADEYRECAAGA